MPHAGTEQRKLAAIMFTDMVGYSALAQRNEALALELLEEHRRVLRSIFPKHNGREIETAGDAFLVEFMSALEAVRCAVEIQEKLSERNRATPGERAIRIRIGIHVGDVVHLEGKVMGDAVNIAARIEPLASPGGICVSEDVARQIHNKLDHPLVTLGPSELKNIELPVVICRVVLPWEKHEPDSSSRVASTGRPKRIRGLATAAVVITVLSVVIWFSVHRRTTSTFPAAATNTVAPRTLTSPGRIEWLVVLPLRNHSGDTNQDFFVDGMTEILIGELGQIAGLKLKSHTTSMHYKGTKKSVTEIGQELRVDAVVEGSMLRERNQALISVRLIEAAIDRLLWTKKFQRDLTDALKMQSEVAEAIAREIQVRLTPQDEARLARARTVNPVALEAYLQGRHQSNRRAPDALSKAIALFQKSVEIDPNFALGHAGLSDAYSLAPVHLDLPSDEIYEKARASAVRAIELDDQLAEPHVSLGYLLANVDWKWSQAEAEFLHAIALNPNYPPAHYWYAYQVLVRQGRTNEALVQAETAVKLDPVTPVTREHYALVLISAGRNEEAIEQVRIILELQPDFPLAHWALYLAHLRLANYAAAIAAGEKLRAKINRPWVWGILGYGYAVTGQKEQALKLLAELKEQPTISLVAIAQIQVGLGMRQEALENLESAYLQRSVLLALLNFYPAFDSLRAEPRFQALLQKVGLKP